MHLHRIVALLVSLLALHGSIAPESAWAFGRKKPRPTPPAEQPIGGEKEWTFLIFLNGNNNLDAYGTLDLNEMERVGSTNRVNIVVQWASYQTKTVRRLLVARDSDTGNVTSPIIENLGRVDMGDYRNLVEFVRWGAERFPAKNYFVNVWNHGSGWHKTQGVGTRDISFDDLTGNAITTEQLGVAMREASAIIGRKISIYGSDACLMSMAEVANEMSDSVDVFVGSEEVEPAPGWPYDKFLERWNALPSAAPTDVARALTEEYVKSYRNGSQGNLEITFSAFDLAKMGVLNSAVKDLGDQLRSLSATDRQKALAAIASTQFFTYRDYGDLADFVSQLEKTGLSQLDPRVLTAVQSAVSEFAFVNIGSPAFARAKGVALWLPMDSGTYSLHATRYRGLQFHLNTGWGDALQSLFR